MSLENVKKKQRFVVLATARTGSNLLMSLLNSYGDIKMHGELFNIDNLPQETLDDVLNDPIIFLKKKLDESAQSKHQAIGFKMFYDHLSFDYFDKMVSSASISKRLVDKYDDFDSFIRNNYSISQLNTKFKSLWNYLSSDTDLKIIHLKRKNKLDTLISLKTAYTTSEWTHWMPKTGNKLTPLHFDYDECYNYFSAIERYELMNDFTFRNHSKLDICYEDLILDKQECTNKVCDFLELPHKTVKTLLKKQITYQPSEIVDNYDDLKEAFRNTSWSTFFV